MSRQMPGKRRTAREMAVQMLYQRDIGGSEAQQIFRSFDVGPHLTPGEDGEDGVSNERRRPTEAELRRVRKRQTQVDEAFLYARRLVEGTINHLEHIDGLIAEQADNWRLERMPVVDRNVLRLAVYEMLYEGEIPDLVVVDEAIELAKRFGSENSGRFVNGLLDGLLKSQLET
ncbi:MAG: transcription antitermination factor NusB [Acidobacteriota bacterium]